ncbi:MAG: hypothetical protein Q8K79_10785 [Solirubrobacteraceae bacterium]|nr:hypothetical protein [Solirubrobacteraceae bacterium]
MSLHSAPEVPAELSALLSRQALGDYSVACEAAQAAAEQAGAATGPGPDAVSRLRDCRTDLIAAEEVLDLLGDETATRRFCAASLDARQRLLVAGLVGITLERLCADLESSEEEICAAAARIQGLRTLFEQLGPGLRHAG